MGLRESRTASLDRSFDSRALGFVSTIRGGRSIRTLLSAGMGEERLEIDSRAREKRLYDRLRARVVASAPGARSGLRDLIFLLPDMVVDRLQKRLAEFQDDVADETIANDDIEPSGEDIASLGVANDVKIGHAKLAKSRDRQLVALALFFADAKNADAGVRNPQDLLSVDRTHEGEVDEVARPTIDIGANIEQQNRLIADNGDDVDQSGPRDARQSPPLGNRCR